MIFRRYSGPHRGMPPLHWTPLDADEKNTLAMMDKAGQVVAIVTCKRSHACALRVPPHSVSPAGVVNPSLGCPVPGCDGHEDPGSVLEGYGT